MEAGVAGRELLVFLVAAGIVVPLFQRLHFGSVLGFLLAGIAVGPGGFGRLAALNPIFGYAAIEDVEAFSVLGDIGILFLLFTIGLELSFGRLIAMRHVIVGAGGVQVVLAAALICGVAALAGFEFDDSLMLGMALALSSTAIVTQALVDQHRLGGAVGRTALGILLLQDLAVVPIVIVVEILGREGADVGLALLKGIGLAAVVVAAVLAVGRFLFRPAMHFAASTGSRTLLLSITLLIVFVAAMATSAAGLSAALGAFLAGLLVSETEYRHQLEVDVEPFKDLLLGLFFMWVGMTVDVISLLAHLPIILAGLAVVVALKIIAGEVACRLSGVPRAVALETALLLAGAGEFAFVVFTLALRNKVIAPDVAQIATTIAALSMVLTPAIAAVARKLGALVERVDQTNSHGVGQAGEFSDHVIIGGFGRFGVTVAALLKAEDVPYVALDLNATRVAEAVAAGEPVFFGDATHPEVLKRIGADQARAFVITTDRARVAERMVRVIHRTWPGAVVHARARTLRHAEDLLAGGASHVVPEALEGSLQLAGQLLVDIGIPEDAVARRLAAARDHVNDRLGRQVDDVN